MNREERAKQFAPFEALKGLREALREKELKHDIEPKKEISEEKTVEIAGIIATLDKGDTIDVKYYESGYYVTVRDVLTKIDFEKKFLVLGEGKILFSDIYEIKRGTII